MLTFVVGTLGAAYITLTDKGKLSDWFCATWEFTKQIVPLLLCSVLISGFTLNRPGYEGIITSEWVYSLVGEFNIFQLFCGYC